MPLDHYYLVDSTLREGEQFSRASFLPAQKLEIAQLLDAFGVEMIEMTSPCASPQSQADIQAVAKAGLNAKIITHIRCTRQDAVCALDSGVDGINITIGTSPQLMQHSHGKSLPQIVDLALDVLSFIREQAPQVMVRFSTEDTFRSREADVLQLFLTIGRLVDRLGVADTVGVATPQQVFMMVNQLVRLTGLDVEFHGHNDSGCSIANALSALEAGGTHIDTTVLGIGERNGITPMGGLIARLYTLNPTYVEKYNLALLPQLDRYVADICQMDIPFNNYITGSNAFVHKAGIHTKAVLANPSTYEALQPEVFGLSREVAIGHRLTGRNAVRDRAVRLGLQLDEGRLAAVTQKIKQLADFHPLTLEEVDSLLQQECSA